MFLVETGLLLKNCNDNIDLGLSDVLGLVELA